MYLSVYVFLSLYEVYLLFYSSDWMMMLIASYLGYSLMANLTILPQLIYITVQESEDGVLTLRKATSGRLENKQYWKKIAVQQQKVAEYHKDKLLVSLGGNKYVYC